MSYIGLAASKGSQFLRCKLESVLYYYTDTQTRRNFSLLVNSKHVHEQPGATTEIVKRVILNGEAQCCLSLCNNISYSGNTVNKVQQQLHNRKSIMFEVIHIIEI